MDQKVAQIMRRYESMNAYRGTWDASFRDIANNIYPRKASFGGGFSPGQKVQQRLWDGTGQRAASMLAAAIHTMVCPMTQAWFDITTNSNALNEDWEVKVWLQGVSKVVNDILLKSNFHTQFHEHLLDYVLFGNGVLFMEEDFDHVIRFSNRALSECMFDENYKGEVDVVGRVFEMTPRTMIQQFETVHPAIHRLSQEEQTMNQKFKVLHFVHPAEEKQGNYMNFKAYYIDIQHKYMMEEGFFRDFPYCISRFERASGETYGRGPGWHALPEAQQLNVLQKHTARAVQKATDPAIMVPDRLFAAPLDLGPSKVNYYRRQGNTNVAHDIQPFPVGSKFEVAVQEKQELKDAINKAFYVDQLNLPMIDRMTTVEVTERMMSKNYVLSPVLGQLTVDTLEKIVIRAFRYADRQKRIMPAPPALQGRNVLKLTYSSPLSKVQRYNELRGFQSALSALAPLVQAQPELLQSLNSNDLFRWAMDVTGGPLSILKTPAQEQQEREQKMKAEQQAMQAQAGPAALSGLSGSIKDIAQAGKFATEAMTMGGQGVPTQ